MFLEQKVAGPSITQPLSSQSHKIMSQSKRWCFTINNPDAAAAGRLAALGQTAQYLVFGREVGTNGTPHLQGFVIFTSNHRLAAAKRAIDDRAHVEPARGTSAQAAQYCKKEGDFEEFGQLPANQGKRNDFEELKEWIVNQPQKPNPQQIAEEFPSLFIRYGRIMEWVDLIYPSVPVVEGDPNEWQRTLDERLRGDPDDRTVIFIVDRRGGRGKTWFCKWFLSQHSDEVQLLRMAKRDDVALSINESKRIFLIDIPRSQSEFLQYSVLEQLKDGLVFSPKYQSRMKHLKKAHVVVFMNEAPDMVKLSADRYDVINLDPLPVHPIGN